VPLLVFCAVGLFFVDTHRFSFTTAPAPASLQEASLLLIFAFGGFEIASVPSEEVVNPKRALPPALVISVGLAVVLYLVIQLVAMGTLPGLAGNTTPLASSAATFLGPAGGLLLTIGAIFSTAGNANGSVMIGGRILYAFAQGGQLPAVLGRIHPRFRTPAISLVVYALAAWAIAVSGTFVQLAAVNALGRLLFSAATCLAVPVLRRKMPAVPERFTLPGGAFIPVLGLAVCAWLLIGSTWNQALITAASIVAGVLLYAIFGYSSRNTSSGL
jgi:amino acid transporter